MKRFLARQLGLDSAAGPRQWLLSLVWVPDGVPLRQRALEMAGAPGRGMRRCLAPLLLSLSFAFSLADKAGERLGKRFLPGEQLLRLGRRLDACVGAAAIDNRRGIAVLLALSAALAWLAITTPLSLGGQGLFLLSLWLLALFVRRIPGRYPNLLLMALALIATGRYAWWRTTQTLNPASSLDLLLGFLLLAAEAYTWLILILGFVQTAWPMKRQPVGLPAERDAWPTVDIYIPTYNEPLAVVKPTVLAACGIDWPANKLAIHILDDGRREEFRRFAQEAGVGYIVRPDRQYAKAGNLNHALGKTHGEFVAIFDCDHLPTRSFLQLTMGWFLRDPKCALLQTPHHFFSPDPFERNLDTFRRIPSENVLFYGLVQDGNDFWNATFFCGSCAILRRGPLDEIGGIAVETVTEDAHTALKLHRLGYTTAYINIPQAAGLATESLAGHIGQRVRWARGMAQIFRIDNPFLGKGLNFFQRLCYGNAMLHFLYGIPRLIFLTAPLAYLFFEFHIINAAAVSILLYALPHIFLSNIANAHIQGPYRHSFWAEVYESVLAWYIALPTTVALLNPRLGKFNVTAKGGVVENSYFDWSISKPYLVLIAANFSGLLLGLFRLFAWNTHETGTVLMNLAWTVYNLLMLGAVVGVATESRQIRVAHRVAARFKAALKLPDGSLLHCRTEDYSLGGLGLVTPEPVAVKPGDRVAVSLWRGRREYVFPAEVMLARGVNIGIGFTRLNIEQEADLVQCTFARADAWSSWTDEHDRDRPLRGLREIGMLGLKGYATLGRHVSELVSLQLAKAIPRG